MQARFLDLRRLRIGKLLFCLTSKAEGSGRQGSILKKIVKIPFPLIFIDTNFPLPYRLNHVKKNVSLRNPTTNLKRFVSSIEKSISSNLRVYSGSSEERSSTNLKSSLKKKKPRVSRQLEAEFKEFGPRLKFETQLKHGWFHFSVSRFEP